MIKWYYFLFLAIHSSIYAAQAPDFYMVAGNVPANGQFLHSSSQYRRNAPIFNQLSASSLSPVKQKISNAALLIQMKLDKLQSLQIKLTPALIKNNVFCYVSGKEHLPCVILQESSLYLQNGIVAEKAKVLSPFHFVNEGLCQFFDKSLSTLHAELHDARNLRNQLCQVNDIVAQNIYLENELVIKALEFTIDVKTQCLQHHESSLRPYSEAIQKTEFCSKNESWDSFSFGVLEKQVGVLQDCIKREEAIIIKQSAILKEVESLISSVNHFYNVFERDELREHQESKAIVQQQIQQSEQTIKLCRSELIRIEPLVAYGRQYQEGINKITIPDINSKIIDAYAAQEIQLHAAKDPALAKAIEQAHQENYSVHSSEYSFTNEAVVTLERLGTNASQECTLHLTGDAIQHYVQGELVTSLNKLGIIKIQDKAKDIFKAAVICNISGQEAVKQKQIVYALEAKEACDRLLDLGLAIGEGFVEGVHNTCDNTIDLAQGTINVIRGNPETLSKITATFTGASQAMTTFLSKYGRWMELKLENPEKARQIRNAYFAKIGDGISQRLSEMSERDKVKFVAQFATEWFLAGEVAAVTGKAMRAGKVVAEEVVLNPLKTLQYEVSEALVATLEKEPALVNGIVEGLEKVDPIFAIATENKIIEIKDGAKIADFLSGDQQIKRCECMLNVGNGVEQINFTATTIERMKNPARIVPVQILDYVIKNTKGFPDPQGTKALMHYSNIFVNKKPYNLEILYHKETNTIQHFMYSRNGMGPLPKIGT